MNDQKFGVDNQDTSKQKKQDVKATGRRYFTLLRTTVVGVLVGLATVILIVGSSMTRLPDFYSDRLSVAEDVSELHGQLCERHLIGAYNQMNRNDQWSVRLSEEHVNGWLASDLPEKFPEILSQKVSQPRIQFSDDRFKLAFKLNAFRLTTVAQITGNVFATQTPNQIVFQVDRVRAGLIPVPVSWWADHLQQRLAEKDIILEWTTWNNELAAMVTLPRLNVQPSQYSVVDAVRIDGGWLSVAGQTLIIHQSLQSPDGADDESQEAVQH